VSRIERIAEDILVLTDLVPIDGRVSWIPPEARGFEPYNEYVVLSDERALLIDTGVALHEESLLESLREVIGPRELVVFVTRIELDCLGNLGRIFDLFPRVQVTTSNIVPLLKLVHVADSTPPPIPPVRLPVGSTLAEFGFPRLRIHEALLRTLGSTWLWDEKTATLFTTDIFCTDMLSSPDESVLRWDRTGLQSPQDIRNFVLRKFDWLETADSAKLLPPWEKFFSQVQPAALAPIHGRIQVGQDLVKQVVGNFRKAMFPNAE
jgi:flavorubredoxin